MCAKTSAAALVLLLTITALSQAQASPQGWGLVHMTGSIIETACAIDTSSRDQTVEMGLMSLGKIIRGGQTINQPFAIKLVNCTLARKDKTHPDWQHFQITFDGKNDTGLFGLSGDAQGVALQIIDRYGNIATPGEPLPKGDITPNEMSLQYSLRLVSNNKLIRAGEFFSTVRFKMDYY